MNRYNNDQAFTLLEMMITLVIVSILASVAFPQYQQFITRVNRSEAQRQLLNLAHLQMQYYADYRYFTDQLTALAPLNKPIKQTTASYHFTIELKNSGQHYLLRAEALNEQKNNDTACAILTLDDLGIKLPAGTCWQ